MASSSQARPGKSTPVKIKFLVEATTTSNERLTAKISALNAREAKERATEQFRCEGHSILSATTSEVKGEGK